MPPITIGYEPVGAIQGLAFEAGKGEKAEYDAAQAQKQAQIDAQQDMQIKLANIRAQLERESSKTKQDILKQQEEAQARRDERLHGYGLEDIEARNEGALDRIFESSRAVEEQRQREIETKALIKKQQAIESGELILNPDMQTRLEELRKLRSQLIGGNGEAVGFSPEEVGQVVAQIDTEMERIQDPKSPNWTKNKLNPSAQDIQHDFEKHVHTFTMPDGREVVGTWDMEKKKFTPISAPEEKNTQKQLKTNDDRMYRLREHIRKAETDLAGYKSELDRVKNNRQIQILKPELIADLEGKVLKTKQLLDSLAREHDSMVENDMEMRGFTQGSEAGQLPSEPTFSVPEPTLDTKTGKKNKEKLSEQQKREYDKKYGL